MPAFPYRARLPRARIGGSGCRCQGQGERRRSLVCCEQPDAMQTLISRLQRNSMDPSVTFFALNQVGEGAKVHVANVGMHSTGTWAVKLRSNLEATGFLQVCGSRVSLSLWISSFTKFGSGNWMWGCGIGPFCSLTHNAECRLLSLLWLC